MSNPGVIKLAEVITQQHTFRVEDNIGEAIHLHFDGIRIDLSVNEYRRLVAQVRDLLENMIQAPGFHLKYIEPLFFMEMGSHWPYLDKAYFEDLYLNDILVDTYVYDEETKMEQYTLRPLSESRVMKYLQGNTSENDKRKQINLFGQSNSERVEDVLRLIKTQGYPVDDKYIVLTNLPPGSYDGCTISGYSTKDGKQDENQSVISTNLNNILYDGQHRASCLYYLYGNIKVKVLHLLFSNELDEKKVANSSYIGKQWPNLKHFAAAHKRLYMFGAGKFANILLRKMRRDGIKVDGVLMTYPDKESFGGIPVLSPGEVQESHEECGVVFALGERFHKEVTQLLDKWGFKSFYKKKDHEIWEMFYRSVLMDNK